jgi:hypothetical protein
MSTRGSDAIVSATMLRLITLVATSTVLMRWHDTSRVEASSLQCSGNGYASYLDTNRVDLMASQWVAPPEGSFTIE